MKINVLVIGKIISKTIVTTMAITEQNKFTLVIIRKNGSIFIGTIQAGI
jgi:hypothetical protein